MPDELLEAKRLEELFRYFLAASHAADLEKLKVDSEDGYDAKLPRISADPVLNGLVRRALLEAVSDFANILQCQLGAVRLDCDRAFVSLIDDRNQYVAAEMTKAGSLVDNSRHPPGEPVFIGTCVLDLVVGVCAATMPAFIDDQHWKSTTNIYADSSRYVINDFTKEEMYRDRPYVTGYPHMRYYAEVPIRTASGYVIGTYAVIDNKTHQGLSEDSYLILTDVATAIMRHIETCKVQADHDRASGLLRGLDTFAQKNNKMSRPRRGRQSSIQHDGRLLDHEQIETVKDNSPTQNRSKPCGDDNIHEQQTSIKDAESSSHAPDSVRRPTARSYKSSGDIASRSPVGGLEEISNEKQSTDGSDASNQANGSGGIKDTFSHAARLLREAMDLDGVVFLDASFSGFGSRNESDWLEDAIMDKRQATSTNDSTFTDVQTRRESAPTQTVVSCLGSSAQSNTAAGTSHSLPQAVHQSLIRNFPLGEVFVLAEERSVTKINLQMYNDLELEDRSSRKSHLRRKYSRRAIVEDVFRTHFPGAQSIIFFPLWDPYKSNWFAGSIGWTTQSKRTFEREDFSYFSVFGNSVMTEIARLELVASDRAMADCISSISHELRSPLHGILGSAELLKETISTPDQVQIVGMIENCGQTLLQTMDQILDYSKVNAPSAKGDSQDLPSSAEQQQLLKSAFGKSVDINMSTLIEESVQALLIGNQYTKSPTYSDTRRRSAIVTRTTDAADDPVTIILDVERSANVVTNIESAAWHRIVLNLVGNALKYTIAGYIEVSLKVGASDPESLSHALFIVNDTGRGMDEAYLRNHLFTPFVQEDSVSDGTGLGMSIVKKIVDSLGGTIKVKSKVGKGTTVTISMPLNNKDVPVSASLLQYPETRVAMFVADPSMVVGAPASAGSVLLRSTVTRNLRDWYQVRLSETTQTTHILAQTYIVDEADLIHLIRTQASKETRLTLSGRCSFIILCTQHGLHDRKEHVQSDRVQYLSPPYGPHQIGAILKSALAQDHSTELTLKVQANARSAVSLTIEQPSKPNGLSMPTPFQAPPEEYHSPTSQQSEWNTPLPTPNEFPSLNGFLDPVSATPPTDQTRKLRLLLIDDNHLNLDILVRSIRKLNCEYTTAINGLDAVTKFKDACRAAPSTTVGSIAHPFDYIFMDISMPVMNGFEATREIRSHERSMQQQGRRGSQPLEGVEGCQIIAMTGLGSAEAQQEALTSGMNLFLKKPVKIKDIRALLDREL